MYTPKFKEKKKFNFMGLAVALVTLLFAAFLGLMLRESADPDTTLGTQASPSGSTQTTQTAPSSEAPSTAPSTQPSTTPSTEPSETIHTHSYTAAEVIKATCTEDGYTLMACVCGVTYHADQVKAAGHEHVLSGVVKPTCTEKGHTVYACHCGDSYKTDEKKAIGHKYEVLEKVAATCVSNGYTTYMCANCGHSYNGDEKAAKGHSYSGTVILPTVEAEGYTLFTCTGCGDSYMDHYTEKLPPPETEPPASDPSTDTTEPSEPQPPVDLPDPTPMLKGQYEIEGKSYGIDVSKYQGKIDWKNVADSGIDFAIVRVGNRIFGDAGTIYEDYTARYNLQEASKYGIKLGAYFFSTAISEEEAIEEANFVADILDKYPITYPVVYDCEAFEGRGNENHRHYGISKEKRTRIAMAFLITIGERGYTPMFYGSKNDMQNDRAWITSHIEKYYKVWVAQYPSYTVDPDVNASSYTGDHVMWQYSDKGQVSGIHYSVDMNVCYYAYSQARAPIDSNPPEEVSFNADAMYDFEAVDDWVTSTSVTNLRSIPSTGADSTVLRQLKKGEVVRRVAMSGDEDSGWSKLLIDGEYYYAVNYLLTVEDPPSDPPVTDPPTTEPTETEPTDPTQTESTDPTNSTE